MKKVDLIVTAPHIYTMKGEGVGYEEKKALVVDGSKIIDIVDIDKLSDQYEAEEQLDMSHHILLPGFIDAHMHTSCNIMRGLAQDTNNWMMYGLQPFDNAATQAEKDIGCPVASSKPPKQELLPWVIMKPIWMHPAILLPSSVPVEMSR